MSSAAQTSDFGRRVLMPGTKDRVLLDQSEVDALDACVGVVFSELNARLENKRVPARIDTQTVGVVRNMRDMAMALVAQVLEVEKELPKPPTVYADEY